MSRSFILLSSGRQVEIGRAMRLLVGYRKQTGCLARQPCGR